MAVASFSRNSSHALGGLSVELASELKVVANIAVGADVPEGSSTFGRPDVAGQVLGAVGCLALIGLSFVDTVSNCAVKKCLLVRASRDAEDQLKPRWELMSFAWQPCAR